MKKNELNYSKKIILYQHLYSIISISNFMNSFLFSFLSSHLFNDANNNNNNTMPVVFYQFKNDF